MEYLKATGNIIRAHNMRVSQTVNIQLTKMKKQTKRKRKHLKNQLKEISEKEERRLS